MRRTALLCASICVVSALPTLGKEYPLAFKTIPVQEVSSFPSVFGLNGPLIREAPPGEQALKSEPAAVSQHPLYGVLRGRGDDNPVHFLFRLDESQGDGKGYDRCILDLNQNQDLTDDPVVQSTRDYQSARAMPSNSGQALFGPIEMPENKKIGANRPVYFAEMLIYNPSVITNESTQNAFIGYLMLKAGCYWEANVEVRGAQHKLGLIDSDCNLRVGEPWQPTTYESGGEKCWYFEPRDSFLIDADGSGRYEPNAFNDEYCSFGSLVYLGGVACRVTLGEGCQSILVEPWTEPMAEVKLQPEGKQVRRVALARETAPDEWQLIYPPVAKANVSVPAGKYRLYSCVLQGKAIWHKPIMASAYHREIKEPFVLKSGQANRMECGAPLNIKVTASKGRPQPWERLNGEKLDPTKDTMLRINAQVLGAGKEIYSGYGVGQDYKGDPSKPTFSVADDQGKLLTKGNLEFG